MQEPILPGPDVTGAVVLISGERDAGKTTLLLAVREAAQRAGLRVGGFLSPGRIEDGQKAGIDLLDAATGARVPLAVAGNAGPIHTRHYSFDAAAFEVAQRQAAAGRAADVLFVDELGPLELQRGEGWVGVIDVIRARQYGVALVVIRPSLLDAARARLGLAADVPVISVDADNRDRWAAALAGWVTQRQTRSPRPDA